MNRVTCTVRETNMLFKTRRRMPGFWRVGMWVVLPVWAATTLLRVIVGSHPSWLDVLVAMFVPLNIAWLWDDHQRHKFDALHPELLQPGGDR